MATTIEVYEKLRHKLGEEEAKLLVEFVEEETHKRPEKIETVEDNFLKILSKLEDLQNIRLENKIDLLEQKISSLEGRVNNIDNRLWWLLGLTIIQWLSLIAAILFKQ